MKSVIMQDSSILEINGKHFSLNTTNIVYDDLLFNYFHSDKCRDTKMQNLEILVIFHDKYLLPYFFAEAGNRHSLY